MIYARFIFLGLLLAMTTCDSGSRVPNEAVGSDSESLASTEKIAQTEACIKSYVDQRRDRMDTFICGTRITRFV